MSSLTAYVISLLATTLSATLTLGHRVGVASEHPAQNMLVVCKGIPARFLELPIWLDGEWWVFP